MGKSDFGQIYRDCKKQVGGKLTCKISYYSDKFDAKKDYGGVIIYTKANKCKWQNTKGKLKGHSGRSFYVIIMETNGWEPEQKGVGKLHPFVIEHHMDMSRQEQMQNICGGGFAFHDGQLKFHSIWLNSGDCCGRNAPYKADGSKKMSAKEQMLTRYIFEQWKAKGPHAMFPIPDDLDKELSK